MESNSWAKCAKGATAPKGNFRDDRLRERFWEEKDENVLDLVLLGRPMDHPVESGLATNGHRTEHTELVADRAWNMIVCVSGSRSINSKEVVEKAILSTGWNIEILLVGDARGVDFQAKHFAMRNGIGYAIFPANWNRLGKKAGFVRNYHMIYLANALCAVWDGESRGTAHTIRAAFQRNRHIVVCDASGKPYYRRSDDGTEETTGNVPGMLERLRGEERRVP